MGGCGPGACGGSTAASTPSAARCSPARAAGSRRSWPAATRGPQPRQRRRPLGPPALRRAAPRGDRPRVAAPGPGDPPAPFSFPRCPGHHQPPRASRSRRCTARCWTSPPTPQTTTSSARWRRPSATSSTTTRRSRRRSPEPTATEAPSATQAIADDPALTRSELERRMRRSPRDTVSRGPCAITTLDAPDHPGLEVDAYFPTHHLVVETDGWATTTPDKPSRTTAPRTPPSPPPATPSCASPGASSATTPTPSPSASERDVPVLALRRLHALGQQRLERGDDLRARLVGDDDVVDVAALGRRCTGWRSAPCSRR